MNEREEQLATQDVEARDEARMNDYMLPPNPGGLNRALDRTAAEHLRAVAPHLAPCLSCQAGLCAEHGPTVTATTTGKRDGITSEPRLLLAVPIPPAPPQPEPAKADAPRKGSKAWAIQEACRIVGIAFHGIAEYDEASDCFCSESPHQDYRNGGHALAFVEQAVREKLAREKAPAPPAEAKGEMSDSVVAALVGMIAPQRGEDSDDRYSRERAIEELLDGIAALRTRAREAEEWRAGAEGSRLVSNPPRQSGHTEEAFAEHRARYLESMARNGAYALGADCVASVVVERNAAREQRDAISDQREDLANEILVERAAAEAEVKRLSDHPHPCPICSGTPPASGKPCACNGTNNVYTAFDYLNAEAARLRLAYDDPSLDATDGAHPAWWRGSDAGVAGAVRIVNEALDGPLPLPGCVGGADLEAVRQRVAALRASVARLVEAGDKMAAAIGADWPALTRAWAAAKAQVKP